MRDAPPSGGVCGVLRGVGDQGNAGIPRCLIVRHTRLETPWGGGRGRSADGAVLDRSPRALPVAGAVGGAVRHRDRRGGSGEAGEALSVRHRGGGRGGGRCHHAMILP
jgi:hypothetical protein